MKIVIVCYPTFGGSGVLATELGHKLAENGHEIHFIAYQKPVRLNADDIKVYFHKNGTYIQSGDPAGNSGGQAIPAGFFYGFSVGNETASDSGTMQVNTGNPLFTISSGNSDANGHGNFEYAVPSGFFAMCTKNIGDL